MTHLSRRTFVAAGSTVGGLILSGPWLPASAARAASPLSANNFRFAIHGLTDNLPGLLALSGGKLTMGVRTNPRGAPGSQLAYNGAQWDDLTFTVQQGPGMIKMQEWVDAAMKAVGCGNALRRDCSLYLLARDKASVMRTINYFGCYPTNCNAGDHSTSSEIKTMTFTCNVDRIEETKG